MLPMSTGDPRVEQWQTWQQAQGLSARTIEARINRVRELEDFTGVAPSDATADHVVRFMASIAARTGYKDERVGPATLATYHSHLKAWFVWLVKMEYRDDDPTMKVPTPKTDRYDPRPVTDREIVAVFNVGMHKRTRMMVLLAAFAGLRVHEIAKIRGEHVNLHDGLIRVIGKGRKDSMIKLHPFIAEAAADFPAKGYWFPTNARGNANHGKEGCVLARSVSSIIGDVFDRAGVEGGAHRLRHWYATTLLHDGASTRLVQTLMRHGSIQSTERYTAVSMEDQAEAILRLRMPTLADVEDRSA